LFDDVQAVSYAWTLCAVLETDVTITETIGLRFWHLLSWHSAAVARHGYFAAFILPSTVAAVPANRRIFRQSLSGCWQAFVPGRFVKRCLPVPFKFAVMTALLWYAELYGLWRGWVRLRVPTT